MSDRRVGFRDEYRHKLVTPRRAAEIVRDGWYVDLGHGLTFPTLCDEALASRRDELRDVVVRGNIAFTPVRTAECDDTQTHFTYNSWHFSGIERALCDSGRAFYSPMMFRNIGRYYADLIESDIFYFASPPMDDNGYFNFSLYPATGALIAEATKRIVVEVNEHLPRVRGGQGESIHISRVDMIVEGEHAPLVEVPPRDPSDAEKRIAQNILPFIKDGATIQLGIGGVPEALGRIIAESDLKDLGMHTEFATDSYLELYRSGRLTNRRKRIDRDKGVFGACAGTREFYDWLDDNAGVVGCTIDYINDPRVIGSFDDFVSLNGCVAADLFGQVSSESAGLRHISGTGGQIDFLEGAMLSNGGRSFICMTSTYTDRDGTERSRIVPHFTGGEIITTPRSAVHYMATEHGVVCLAGQPTWRRAEMMISLAAPQFRDELIAAAERQGVWRRSNKR